MNIIFKKIRWKNFLAFGNSWTEVDFQSHLSTLFIGKNGAGKSTLLDALNYVLFKKPYRKINLPLLVNSVNGKGTVVEIDFIANGVEYTVKRGIKPALFEIIEGGIKRDQDASTGADQEYLESKVLKMNQKAFTQNILLGSANYVPFMQLTAPDRRVIIENMLDIGVFSVMSSLLKDKVKDTNKELKDIENGIDLLTNKVTMQRNNIEALQKKNDDQVTQIQNQISEVDEEINGLDLELQELEEKAKGILELQIDTTKLDVTKQKCQNFLNDFLSDKRPLEKEVKFFTDNENCPTCTQPIGESFRASAIDKKTIEINNLESKISEISIKKTEIEEKLKKAYKLAEELSDANSDVRTKKAELKGKQETRKRLSSQIKSLQEEEGGDQIEVAKLDLETYIKELEEKKTAKAEITEQINIFNIATFILKDTGIKARIVKQYVPVINSLINKYLTAMDFFVQFELDENFNETIKSRYRDEFTYESFSQGQKARLDLALLLTWRDISRLRNSISTNLLVMDEVFDGSLDSDGESELLKIIKTLSSDENIIVITHKTDQYFDHFDRVIKFEMKKNFSNMEIL